MKIYTLLFLDCLILYLILLQLSYQIGLLENHQLNINVLFARILQTKQLILKITKEHILEKNHFSAIFVQNLLLRRLIWKLICVLILEKIRLLTYYVVCKSYSEKVYLQQYKCIQGVWTMIVIVLLVLQQSIKYYFNIILEIFVLLIF